MNWTTAHCHPDRRPEHVTPQEWNRIWFPNPTAPLGRRPDNRSSRDMYALARLYCASCPAREQCLSDALANNETVGMWGGHTPNERRDLRWRPRRCRNCGDVFVHQLPPRNGNKGGSPPVICSEACRVELRNKAQAAYVARRATENYQDVDLECECGHVSPNRSGLTLHKKLAHGEAA